MTTAGEIIMFDSLVGRSNLPQREKSYIRRWADQMTGGKLSETVERYNPGIGMHHVSAGLSTLRQGAEGITMGMALGALSAHDMLEPWGFPLDGGGGAILTLLGVMGAGHEASQDARNAGIAGMTIYSFRKVEALLKHMSSHVAGEGETDDNPPDDSIDTDGTSVGEDPIVAFSKTL